MWIFPAIDLRNGQVVRLQQGDYDQMTVYGDDPLTVANAFAECGAKHLHMVDLDAAKDGGQRNLDVIKRIAQNTDLFIEVGGGARDEISVQRYIDVGVDRVIVGTMAVENPNLMEMLARRHPGMIAAGVDARDGYIATHGWRTITDVLAFDFLKALPERGVDTTIYTDIACDGMLKGPNIPAYEALCQIKGLNVIASGGVSSIRDVTALFSLNLYGCIIGKALYDGHIDLREAIKQGGQQDV